MACQGLNEMVEDHVIAQSVQGLENKDNIRSVPVPHVEVRKHLL